MTSLKALSPILYRSYAPPKSESVWRKMSRNLQFKFSLLLCIISRYGIWIDIIGEKKNLICFLGCWYIQCGLKIIFFPAPHHSSEIRPPLLFREVYLNLVFIKNLCLHDFVVITNKISLLPYLGGGEGDGGF